MKLRHAWTWLAVLAAATGWYARASSSPWRVEWESGVGTGNTVSRFWDGRFESLEPFGPVQTDTQVRIVADDGRSGTVDVEVTLLARVEAMAYVNDAATPSLTPYAHVQFNGGFGISADNPMAQWKLAVQAVVPEAKPGECICRVDDQYLFSQQVPMELGRWYVISGVGDSYGSPGFDANGDYNRSAYGAVQFGFSAGFTPLVPIPEPSTLTLFGGGLLSLVLGRHFRRTRAARNPLA